MTKVCPVYTKICPVCGRKFRTTRRRKTYCDYPCYERARKHRWYLRKKAKEKQAC